MDYQNTLPRPKWSANSIIRHKLTCQPYLVHHVFTGISTLVTKLGEETPIIINARDYDNYALESHFETIQKGERLQWIYAPLNLWSPS